MVSPRRDRWTVSGYKPEDITGFDLQVPQPLGEQIKYSGYGSAAIKLVFETFENEEDAALYAANLIAHGATSVRVAPPKKVIFKWNKKSHKKWTDE